MKNISVIIRNLPFNTHKNAEALRMSVGLTLREDKVTVIFMDDGVYTATRTKPEIINIPPPVREFGALTMLKCKMIADKSSLEKRGIKELIENIHILERDEIVRTISESDIIIPF
ncbi:MAG: sulfur reduction protein DsrE [Candidatus Methanoperedenaceae archaeon]|nr:MAG: sulfur reduction protein DsrE [Candidatus Methanoperedenaceae archaeon]